MTEATPEQTADTSAPPSAPRGSPPADVPPADTPPADSPAEELRRRGGGRGKTFVPRLVVLGVGGAGGNVVNNMISNGIKDADFMVANTDMQDLERSEAPIRVQIGVQTTQGLGTGADPECGKQAAEESIEEVLRHLQDTHLLFITAGMGGGTGTGATGVIARRAREQGILTLGMVTKPFDYEGAEKMRVAEDAIVRLHEDMDKLIVISNQNLFALANEQTPLSEAFGLADKILSAGITGITEAITRPGLINVDFADVRTVMQEKGHSVLGTGEAEGEERAVRAIDDAINNRLVEDVSLGGARTILLNVTGGQVGLHEVHTISARLQEEAGAQAKLVTGVIDDASMANGLKVCVMAAGIPRTDSETVMRSQPHTSSRAHMPHMPPPPQPTRAPEESTLDLEEMPSPLPSAIQPRQESEPPPPKKGILPTFFGRPKTAPAAEEALPRAKAGWFTKLFGDLDEMERANRTYADAQPAEAETAESDTADNLSAELPTAGAEAEAEKPVETEAMPAAQSPTAGVPTAGLPTAGAEAEAEKPVETEEMPAAQSPTAGVPTAGADTAAVDTAAIDTADNPSAKLPTAGEGEPEVLKEEPQSVSLPPVEVKPAPALKFSDKKRARKATALPPEPAEDDEQEQLEIPTFLRRQNS